MSSLNIIESSFADEFVFCRVLSCSRFPRAILCHLVPHLLATSCEEGLPSTRPKAWKILSIRQKPRSPWNIMKSCIWNLLKSKSTMFQNVSPCSKCFSESFKSSNLCRFARSDSPFGRVAIACLVLRGREETLGHTSMHKGSGNLNG